MATEQIVWQIKVDSNAEQEFAKISTQITSLNRVFERLGTAGKEAATKTAKEMQGVGSAAEKSGAQVVQAANKSNAALNQTSASANMLKNSFLELGAAMGVMLGVSQVFEFGKSIAQLGIQFEQTSVSFEVLTGSAEKAKELIADLQRFAAATPFEFKGLSEVTKTLLAFGFQTSEVIPTLRRLGDVASGLNVPLSEIALIYGKARVAGKLMQQDINELNGRGIPMTKELVKMFSAADKNFAKLTDPQKVAKVRDMTTDGMISFQHLEKVMSNLTGTGGLFFDMMARQSQTTGGKISTLSDNFNTLLTELGTRMLPTLNAVIDAASRFIAAISPAAVVAFFSALSTLIVIALKGLGVFAAWRLGVLATNAAMIAFTAVQKLVTVGFTGMAVSIRSVTAAMLANPFGLIAAALTGAVLLIKEFLVETDNLASRLTEVSTRVKAVKDEITTAVKETDGLVEKSIKKDGLFFYDETAYNALNEAQRTIIKNAKEIMIKEEARLALLGLYPDKVERNLAAFIDASKQDFFDKAVASAAGFFGTVTNQEEARQAVEAFGNIRAARLEESKAVIVQAKARKIESEETKSAKAGKISYSSVLDANTESLKTNAEELIKLKDAHLEVIESIDSLIARQKLLIENNILLNEARAKRVSGGVDKDSMDSYQRERALFELRTQLLGADLEQNRQAAAQKLTVLRDSKMQELDLEYEDLKQKKKLRLEELTANLSKVSPANKAKQLEEIKQQKESIDALEGDYNARRINIVREGNKAETAAITEFSIKEKQLFEKRILEKDLMNLKLKEQHEENIKQIEENIEDLTQAFERLELEAQQRNVPFRNILETDQFQIERQRVAQELKNIQRDYQEKRRLIMGNNKDESQLSKEAQAELLALQSQFELKRINVQTAHEQKLSDLRKQAFVTFVTGSVEVINATLSAISAVNEAQIAFYDKLISKQQQVVEGMRNQAAEGKRISVEGLREEEERLRVLNEERKARAREQIVIAQAQALANAIVAISRAAAEGGGFASAATIAATLISLGAGFVAAQAQISAIDIPTAAEGGFVGSGKLSRRKGQSTVLVGNSHAGGGMLIEAEGGEAILPKTVVDANRGLVESLLKNRNPLIYKNSIYDKKVSDKIDFSNLAEKLDKIHKAISEKPITQFIADENGFSTVITKHQKSKESANKYFSTNK